MAKSRCIPTDFFKDPDIMALSSGDIRQVLLGLVLNADDEGRGVAEPSILAREFAYAPAEIETAMREIEQNELVLCYQVGKRHYYSLTRWHEWQSLRRPVASKFPAPPDTRAVQQSPNHEESDGYARPQELPTTPRPAEIQTYHEASRSVPSEAHTPHEEPARESADGASQHGAEKCGNFREFSENCRLKGREGEGEENRIEEEVEVEERKAATTTTSLEDVTEATTTTTTLEKVTEATLARGPNGHSSCPENVCSSTPHVCSNKTSQGYFASNNRLEDDKHILVAKVAGILRIEVTSVLTRLVEEYQNDPLVALLVEADAAREYLDDLTRNVQRQAMTPAFFRRWLKREREGILERRQATRASADDKPLTRASPGGQVRSNALPGSGYADLSNLRQQYDKQPASS